MNKDAGAARRSRPGTALVDSGQRPMRLPAGAGSVQLYVHECWQTDAPTSSARRAAAYVAASSPKMKYPLVLDMAAEGVPVAVTCRVLGFSKQAFSAWRAAPVPRRDWDEAHLINAAAEIHADDPAFGYLFIADELPAPGRTTLARLCSQQQIWSVFSKKRGLRRQAGPPEHDDWVAGSSPRLPRIGCG